MKLRSILVIALTSGILAFWASPSQGEEASPGTSRSASSDGAAVSFGNLEDGDVVPPEFHVKFSITGMGIAPAGVEIENTGHHHLLVDTAELPDFDQPLPSNSHVIHFDKGQTETRRVLAEGKHRLQLILADYRHIPHDPPVISEPITITVSANAPAQGGKEQE